MKDEQIYFNSKANRVGAILLIADAAISLLFFLLNVFYLNFYQSLKPILFSISLSIVSPVLLALGVYKKNNPAIVLTFFYITWHFYGFYSLLKNVGYLNLSERPIFIVHLAGAVVQTLILIGIFVCLILIRMEKEKFIKDTSARQF